MPDNASFEVSPTSLNFGTVTSGATNTLTVTVTNPTNSNVSVSCGSPFTCSPATVPANGSTTVSVVYTASGNTTHSGTLSFSGQPSTVGLSGTSTTSAAEALSSSETSDRTEDGLDNPTVNRFRLHVPTKNTQLIMGKRFAGTTGNSYDGFGLSTEGDIFINAFGSSSDLFLQGTKDVLLQSSEGSTFTLAKGDNVVAGAGSANMMSGGGVLIVAGHGEEPVAANGTDPPDIQGIKDLQASRGTAAAIFTAFDASVAFGSAIRGAYGIWQGGMETARHKKLQTALSGMAAVAGVVGGSFSASGAFPGSVVYGAGGVMLASPAFSGFYSIGGLVLMSTYPFLFGVDAEVYGLNTANLTSLVDTNVSSRKSTTVDSGDHVKIHAGGTTGGTGKIGMQAHEVNVGLPYTGAPTIRTRKVTLGTVNPLNRVALDDNAGAVTLDAAQKMELTVGLWKIEVTPTGITIGKAGNVPSIEVSALNSSIKFNAGYVGIRDIGGGQIQSQNGQLTFSGTRCTIL
ncbi:MAG: hypothetical protein AAGF12_18850 [Myxococcota bacterium]